VLRLVAAAVDVDDNDAAEVADVVDAEEEEGGGCGTGDVVPLTTCIGGLPNVPILMPPRVVTSREAVWAR
jgi:hypothetical protein